MPSSSDHSAASITSRSFAVRRKGFDPDEVRAYLGQLTEVISRLTSERDLARAEAESLRSAAEARPEIDEDQLTAVLGEETARVLSSARKAATEMKERAEESVARMLRDAAAEAGDTRRQAETDAARIRDEAATVRLEADEARREAVEQAEVTGARIRAEAEADADAVRSAADEQQAAAVAAADEVRAAAEVTAEALRSAAEAVLAERTTEAEQAAAALRGQGEADAAALRAQAEADVVATASLAEAEREARQAEGREMVAEAQRVRERMLADLSRRRKAARVQLEQLQAGRDRLLESYEVVQREVDAATTGLRGALPEARAAAEAARVRAEADPADSIDQLEAQIAAARSAGLPLVASDDDADGADEDGAGEDGDAVDEAVDLTDGAPSVDSDEAVDLTEPTPADLGDPSDQSIPEALADEGSAADDASEPPTGPAAASDDLRDEAGPPPVGDGAEVGAGPDPDAVASLPSDEDADHSDQDDEPPEEVEELFARLRASRTESVEHARTVLGAGPDAGPGSGDPGPALESSPVPAPLGAAAAAAPSPEAGGVDDAASDDDAAQLVSMLERRDGAIEPIENRVARRLKRVLADEQGRVLDGVRRAKGSPGLDEILPLDEQLLAYAAAVVDDLLAAAEEGASFEGAVLPSTTSVDAVAEELGRSVAAMVRPRVDRCFEAGEDPDDTSDRLRATYREWKTDSLVDATRHHVLAAFGWGQCAVRPVGSPVRWVSDPAQSACPDCEDDALAGPVPSGDSFPTGHTHPPAHPGCRCLVIGERVGVPA